MDNLFKALPRDLQWEVLTEFVGTHVVRNGRLMRKMTGEIQKELAKTTRNIGGLRLILKPLYRPLGRWIAYDGHCFNTKVLLLVKRKMYVYLCIKPGTPDSLSYVYIIFNQTHVVPINSRDALPPYIKNTYPSYPDTDKKKAINSLNKHK